MKVVRDWVRLPAPWVEARGLRQLRWVAGKGAVNTTALMALIAIAHHADQETGVAKVTYTDLCEGIGLSRSTLSKGLKVLIELGLIEHEPEGRSTYKLTSYDDGSRWGKIPARALYSGKRIEPFRNFTLRNQTELNALKLFVLLAIRRDYRDNITQLSYGKITEYSGIDRNKIRSAISFLGAIGLIHLERVLSQSGDGAMFNAYRIPHVDAYAHPAAQVRS